MNPHTVNLTLAAGLLLDSVGAGLQFGAGWGLIAAGVQLFVGTFAMLRLMRPSAR